jgi:hypothetical protein
MNVYLPRRYQYGCTKVRYSGASLLVLLGACQHPTLRPAPTGAMLLRCIHDVQLCAWTWPSFITGQTLALATHYD